MTSSDIARCPLWAELPDTSIEWPVTFQLQIRNNNLSAHARLKYHHPIILLAESINSTSGAKSPSLRITGPDLTLGAWTVRGNR